MKTAHEIFLTVGVPIAHSSRDYGPNNYAGFRAFNEHDIKAIQDEAFKAGMRTVVDTFAAKQEILDALERLP